MAVEYRVANWVDVAGDYREQAAVVHLDANWAAPARYSGRGVDYVTHPITDEATSDFPESELQRDEIDTSRTIADMIDAAWDALKPGGWLLMDADSSFYKRETPPFTAGGTRHGEKQPLFGGRPTPRIKPNLYECRVLHMKYGGGASHGRRQTRYGRQRRDSPPRNRRGVPVGV
ncbi:hypothetical protein [Halorubrum sp. Atlit-26R]|uniref:hypothetical protein n=1 Tax=Halorubrum sp. Atlit-26R TaxID=2282128 RepID=UPI0011C41694|nr:hypothetical protein [Halorubrum sp. Atlit-26R]